MTRARDAVITLLCLMILVPLMVLSTALAGFDSRHWSGISLSAMQLPWLDSSPRGSDTRPSNIDEVTDTLIAMEDHGWAEIYGGQDGRIYITTRRLSPSLFPDLGDRFDGDEVGVIYSPLMPEVSLDGPGDGSGTGTWWQRTDPLGTWVTLMFGFPWQLGTALLLTAIVWTLILRRRHSRRASAPQPTAAP
ncbi:hypothetical protein ACFO1B_19675 [Dactylosporangium siamense]|uniref:Uncharacterized protein n=1 Tax=Dactylosporangium siamense TaxID=685454 RepID=A0A919PKG0_9ACTN|nr:hypothetical protein [Dactylosporangium siamense]GIG44105.1 hypothetical protein Dsi01nite_021460 [Dactylosporangium siamense]